MDLHVFPIPIPPPTSLSTRSLWVFPVHQPRALVSCSQPGLVICFTLDNIHISMPFSLIASTVAPYGLSPFRKGNVLVSKMTYSQKLGMKMIFTTFQKKLAAFKHCMSFNEGDHICQVGASIATVTFFPS